MELAPIGFVVEVDSNGQCVPCGCRELLDANTLVTSKRNGCKMQSVLARVVQLLHIRGHFAIAVFDSSIR